MVQYDWEILSLYTAPSEDGLSNVVKRVTWRYQAKEGSNSADIYRDTYFSSPNPDSFVVFDELDSSTIIGWIQSIENMSEIKASVDAKLELDKNPPIVEKNPPWVYDNLYSEKDLYIMTKDGEFYHGPIFWNSDSFNKKLKELNLEPSLPENILARKRGIVPIDSPLIISENVRIYKTILTNERPESTEEEELFDDYGKISWDLSGNIAYGTYEIVSKPLENAKINAFMKLASIRNDKEFLGVNIFLNSKSYTALADPISRLILIEKISNTNDNSTFNWKFDKGEWVLIDKDDLLYVSEKISEYVDELNVWEYNISESIKNASTVDELRQIDFS